MNGRSIFAKLHFLIKVIIQINAVLPYSVNEFLYTCFCNVSGTVGLFLRYILLNNLLASCGSNVSIHTHVIIKNKRNLSVGSNVSIHAFCYLEANGGIEIGNNVSIAHGVSMLSEDHSWNESSIPIKYNPLLKGKITIEDDVWIGCGVRILKGVTIHSRSIVAAGSVVNKNVDMFSIVGGVPAKLIKKIIE
jgi:acetyltransferase-like isoleucine patch superfamily enzyme